MDVHRLAWMLGLTQLAVAAALLAMGEERSASHALGLGLWTLTFALDPRWR